VQVVPDLVFRRSGGFAWELVDPGNEPPTVQVRLAVVPHRHELVELVDVQQLRGGHAALERAVDDLLAALRQTAFTMLVAGPGVPHAAADVLRARGASSGFDRTCAHLLL
jgi:hypothetical protein